MGEVGLGWGEGLAWLELEGLGCVWLSQAELGWVVWAGGGPRWVVSTGSPYDTDAWTLVSRSLPPVEREGFKSQRWVRNTRRVAVLLRDSSVRAPPWAFSPASGTSLAPLSPGIGYFQIQLDPLCPP